MDTVSRLKNVPLFAALTPDSLAQVAVIATRQFYPKGNLLCIQDQSEGTLFIIDRGEVILRQTDLQGVEKPVSVLSEGQSIGDDALLLGEACGISVQAITDVEALSIHRQDLSALFQEHPELEGQFRVRRLIKEQLHSRSLPGQDTQEPWLLKRKRHWFAFARKMPVAVVTFLILTTIMLVLHQLQISLEPWFVIPFVSVIPLAMTAWFVIDWQNDYYLVTSRRLVYQEQVLLRSQTVDEVPLVKIQSYTISRQLTGNLLGFGTLQIRTAGGRGPIVLDYLQDPEGMQAVIFKQAGHLLSKLKTEERDEIRNELQRIRMGQPARLDLPQLLPQPEKPRRNGLLSRLTLSRPLLRLRYEQANQVTWRKHWIFLLKRTFLALPASVLLSALVVALLTTPNLAYRSGFLLGCLVLWVAAVFWLWWELTDWRNDEYTVTDDSIMDIAKKPLFFDEQRKKASLHMIQSVSLKKPGLWAALLNYGDVLIQTAGPEGSINFAGVHRPVEVQREVFRRIEAYQDARQRRERARQRAELSNWFEVHEELPPRLSSGTPQAAPGNEG